MWSNARTWAFLVILPVVVLMAGPGCKRRGPRPAAPGVPFETYRTSAKLSTFVFKEEGKQFLFTVGVNATRFHDQDDFIPLTVVLVNKTSTPLLITRESFTLVEPVGGARYGLASISEVRKQGKQQHDRRLMDLDHFGTKLSVFSRVPSNFFPFQFRGIVSDSFELHNFQYMVDNLYFPRPEGDLLGKTFELHLNARGLEQDLFVVFTVPEK